MTPELREKLLAGLKDGSIVPYLGPGVLADVKNVATGAPIPADSDSLIYAMNDGKPMAPKLMYEFPRAAMNVELKRGRSAVTKFLNHTWPDAGADCADNEVITATALAAANIRITIERVMACSSASSDGIE